MPHVNEALHIAGLDTAQKQTPQANGCVHTQTSCFPATPERAQLFFVVIYVKVPRQLQSQLARFYYDMLRAAHVEQNKTDL